MSACGTCGGGYGVHDAYTHGSGAYAPGPWEDDEPGDKCSACEGYGGGEDYRDVWHDCVICDGTGIAQ